MRFVQNIKKGDITLSPDILSSYIMPIVSCYLSGSYEKHNNLVDAAIMAVGVVCRRLPWIRYDAVLQYYLKLVIKVSDRQKTIIK